jgi:hypothetical protein
MPADNNLTWLTEWFAARCDGEWESDFGITIESVNNPGWMVRIDLDGTGLDPSSFETIAEQRSPSNWVECRVEDGAWLGGAGVANLEEVLGLFRAWVEGRGPTTGRQDRAKRPEPRKPADEGRRPDPRGGSRPWRKPGGPRR